MRIRLTYDESWTRSYHRTPEEIDADQRQIDLLLRWVVERRRYPPVRLEERETEGRLPIFRPV